MLWELLVEKLMFAGLIAGIWLLLVLLFGPVVLVPYL